MIDQKTFQVDTKRVAAHLLLRLSSMGIVTTLQNVGSFMDSSRNKIAQITAHYYLARLSQGRSISMDAVSMQINQLVNDQMCRQIPSMTGPQLQEAGRAILQTIASTYSAEYPADQGVWDNCRLVSLTPSEYAISAQRQRIGDAAANEPITSGQTGVSYGQGGWGMPARLAIGG